MFALWCDWPDLWCDWRIPDSKSQVLIYVWFIHDLCTGMIYNRRRPLGPQRELQKWNVWVWHFGGSVSSGLVWGLVWASWPANEGSRMPATVRTERAAEKTCTRTFAQEKGQSEEHISFRRSFQVIITGESWFLKPSQAQLAQPGQPSQPREPRGPASPARPARINSGLIQG